MSETDFLKDLETLLICPSSGGKLILSDARDYFISYNAGLKYPIRDNIPIMVIEEAEAIDS